MTHEPGAGPQSAPNRPPDVWRALGGLRWDADIPSGPEVPGLEHANL
jgi:hypothetical protein